MIASVPASLCSMTYSTDLSNGAPVARLTRSIPFCRPSTGAPNDVSAKKWAPGDPRTESLMPLR
eukprot:4866931-Prymnesium_polylepis.1